MPPGYEKAILYRYVPQNITRIHARTHVNTRAHRTHETRTEIRGKFCTLTARSLVRIPNGEPLTPSVSGCSLHGRPFIWTVCVTSQCQIIFTAWIWEVCKRHFVRWRRQSRTLQSWLKRSYPVSHLFFTPDKRMWYVKYIYHQLPPACFGACYTIFREIIALLAQKVYAFAMLLHRLCCKMYYIV